MSFNHKNLLVVCTFVTLSTVLFSAAASGESICSNPLQKICKDTSAQRKERETYVSNLKKEISDEAHKNAAPRIAEMKKTIKIYHPIRRLINSIKIRNQEIMASAKRRINGFESVVTNSENVNKMKNYMNQAIDTSSFDMEAKTNLKSIVKTIVIGNFGDFLEKSGLENDVLSQLLNNACGSDGMVDNAFATTLNGERYVLVCPGLLITSNQAANDSDRFNNILHVIAHEMGHHIDNSKVGNALYAPYLACLATNYSDSFNKTKDDEKFCKANGKDSTKCKVKVVLSHSGELVADQWGIRTTVMHARAEAYSFADAEQMLTDSWSKLCGSGDEGIHPTGDFRIGTLMRTNPEVSEYLSCANTNSKPACSFAGESVN